jgi:oligopeptide/dipeptide ABC transporter ATP-binding protein
MRTDDGLERDRALLEVRDLAVHFGASKRRAKRSQSLGVRALDGVSFSLQEGECLAVVGESGSGKSTLARAVLRLIEPTAGSVRYRGRDLTQMSSRDLRSARRHFQMIFQDPYASLHPRQTVSEIISEPWKVHSGLIEGGRDAERRRIVELLEEVGLAASYADVYPSRLSGGERQRVAIARALALSPALLVLDEPVSALDVSIQAQVIKVLMQLQRNLGLTYVFISHDLALVRLVADRVAVMYRGRFVEVGVPDELYAHPQHPYTQLLLGSSPRVDGPKDLNDAEMVRPGTVATDSGTGCGFAERCWRAQDKCLVDDPELLPRTGDASHVAACHFADVRTSLT